jgi:pimeloyl-ACP methyl ester carboxylesterase
LAFVLVHGGGFAGSCWDLLAPLLDPPVCVVDLPGRGARPADLSLTTVADFADAVVEDIAAAHLRDVVLVGHSLAGITLPAVAARIPSSLRRLVFVACVVPATGQTVGEVLATLGPAASEVAARIGSEAVTDHGTMHRDLAVAMFCNDMDAKQTDFTLARLVPESLGVLNDPIDLRGLQRPIPRTYVRLGRDASVVPDTQDTMIVNIAPAGVIELDAGHMAMITQPAALARILNAL